MNTHSLNAIILIASCALSTAATAQTAYKCGNSYSQTECPDGVAIDKPDQRTPAQKAQTDLAAKRDAEIALAMEKTRLEQEKLDRASNKPPLPKPSVKTVKKPDARHASKKKKKEPAYFTARVPGQKASRPTSRKSKPKADASKS